MANGLAIHIPYFIAPKNQAKQEILTVHFIAKRSSIVIVVLVVVIANTTKICSLAKF